jgi:hypothetical protein
MPLETEAALAKERVTQTFGALLDELVPMQGPAELEYSDLLDRAMALRTAVYYAFLREYATDHLRYRGHDEEGIARRSDD